MISVPLPRDSNHTVQDPLAHFQAMVLEANRSARHRGHLQIDSNDALEIRQSGVNPLCGDSLEFQLVVSAPALGQQHLISVRFIGEMSAITLASAELLARMLEGKTLLEASEHLSRAEAVLVPHTNGGKGWECQPNSLDELAPLGDFLSFSVLQRFPVRIKTASLSLRSLQNAVRRALDQDFRPAGAVSTE